jgi:hypothetical protein
MAVRTDLLYFVTIITSLLNTSPLQMKPTSDLRNQCIGLIIATIFLAWLYRTDQKSSALELTLGKISPNSAASEILATDYSQSEQVVRHSQSSSPNQLVWLGNSQLTTINEKTEGEKTAVEQLHYRLKPLSWTVSGYAPPNANLQEHLLLFSYVQTEIKPKILLLAVCFDDLRESGIRPRIAKAIESEEVKIKLEATRIGKSLLAESFDQITETSPQNPTTADQAEEYLNDFLNELPIWAQRGSLRSRILINIHYFRNTLFGIKPQTIRKMIPSRMDRNIESLNSILKLATENGCKVLLYIPPLRTDVPPPYEKQVYYNFKNEMKEITIQFNVEFADFQDLVPGNAWGLKASTTLDSGQELDFMHFTNAGHEMLERAIVERIIELGWLK